MKKLSLPFLLIIAVLSLVSCGNNSSADITDSGRQNSSEKTSGAASKSDTQSVKQSDEQNNGKTESKTLVAYFSATGNTKNAAENLTKLLDADLFEILPAEPYTDEDLDYTADGSRVNKEHQDSSIRPEISNKIENIESYDIIFLGFPVWWDAPPQIINTFIESYDFNGKTIIPFVTSASSGINGSMDYLRSAYPDNINWVDGERFQTSNTYEDLEAWVTKLKNNKIL